MGKHVSLETWIKLVRHKAYFDQGLGLTGYVKYMIAFFGLATQELGNTMILAVGYAFLCYILGWLAYHSDFMRGQNEFGNRYNPFCDEMRAHIKKRQHKT